jgi:hypothetical protein
VGMSLHWSIPGNRELSHLPRSLSPRIRSFRRLRRRRACGP